MSMSVMDKVGGDYYCQGMPLTDPHSHYYNSPNILLIEYVIMCDLLVLPSSSHRSFLDLCLEDLKFIELFFSKCIAMVEEKTSLGTLLSAPCV